MSTKAAKNKPKKKNQNRFLIAEGVLILVLVAGMFVWNLTKALKGNQTASQAGPAVTIDGEDYELSEFNYYFYSYYNRYLEQYADYVSYMFDQSKPLKDQIYEGEESWFTYFKEEAEKSMVSTLILQKEAEKNGTSLSDEDEEAMEEHLKELSSSAKESELSTDAYLAGLFGEGMTETLYRKHLKASYLARSYVEDLKESYQFSEEEIEQYRKEHEKEYTFVNYERFYVKACQPDETPSAEQKAQAKALAEEIEAKVKAGETLEEASKAYEDKGTYYQDEAAYYSESFSYGEWLFNEDRKAGDCTVIDDGNGYYVMVYHSGERPTEDGSGELPEWKKQMIEELSEQKYQEWFRKKKEETAVQYHEDVLDAAAALLN